MDPHAIRLVVDVAIDDEAGSTIDADAAVGEREAVITGVVSDVGDDVTRRFSGHLGLITAIEQAISAAAARRPRPGH